MLIDAFVLTAIFGVLVGTFIITLRAVNNGKVRVGAAAIASEQMEKLRNLPYDSLSTQDGTILPQGNILDTQVITRSSVRYTVQIIIVYIDDPYDGCAIPSGTNLYQCTDGTTSAINDTVPVDYKRITVNISQEGSDIILSTLSSNASAKAAETASNTGMLLTIVQDAQGNPIANATVVITNTSTGVAITAYSNALGQVFVANVPPDNQNGYHIVVQKSGYSSDYTTSRTSQNPNQIQPDVDVNIQQITTQTLVIDLLSSMVVTVKNELGSPVASTSVTATSSKITAFNPDTPKNVYNMTTDANGIASFTSIEWDSYAITVADDYIVLVTSPYQKITLNPDTTVDVSMTVTNQSGWPLISLVSPTSAPTGSQVVLLIEGDNFDSSSTSVSLRRSGYPDILAASTDVDSNKKSVEVEFNLNGIAPGDWDVVISSNSRTVIQAGGFSIQ